jgi:hypothetical protein
MKLQEDIDRNKELMNIVNFSDLIDAGTWSPNALVRKKQGREIYTLDNGKFVKRDREPEQRQPWNHGHKPKGVFYLTDEEANTVNEMMVKVRELESESKRIRQEIKDIVGEYKK